MTRHDPNGGLDYESPEDQARDDAELLARKPRTGGATLIEARRAELGRVRLHLERE